ncbi:MAG: 50S ribosomal protein L2 [Candidatus Vogelbacteria bacterium CG10_big_fil_rev_8_21_14_0_10_51_16]|uniref:Large ribosomal subunit protein uL2 n=1 Tax=Candidatus Vogelbacteria bacterium CG10_big_fil_rev_8_21_14_0_10_51_16 TaxID=1975045 RepID=A0A2H0RDN5_9BACT|nr:MAG: 50S ribosomal protein L2 [Candidatus Vogelbacteria bacterium CG10_big_fil_rev_8_21_14_0_10_51_16]
MKKRKPTTAGNRQTSHVSYAKFLTVAKPHKPLTSGGKRRGGRNQSGRITVQHQGGGHKRRFRDIDFLYNKYDIPAVVETLEYDPYRTGFIALVCYRDGERRYVLAPHGLKVGDEFVVSDKAEEKPGNRMQLQNITAGTRIFNVELHPRGGAKFARSAGNAVELLGIDGGYATVRMPSSEVRRVNAMCAATIGGVSNEEWSLRSLGKAGRSRWLGIRPTVRGTAMNPVDHPYGGGEGRQGRGTKRPKTRYGKVTGGHKTRSPKKYSNTFMVSRRKNKKRK